ncbi:dihydrodipicolinate synthase family protein, partial [Mesorhizobium sp. M7A.F.Ca.US.003.02.2.1]
YARMLPAAVFVMQGIENLICYGKRLFGARAGIPIHDRAPAMRPNETGVAMVARFAADLGRLPG